MNRSTARTPGRGAKSSKRNARLSARSGWGGRRYAFRERGQCRRQDVENIDGQDRWIFAAREMRENAPTRARFSREAEATSAALMRVRQGGYFRRTASVREAKSAAIEQLAAWQRRQATGAGSRAARRVACRTTCRHDAPRCDSSKRSTERFRIRSEERRASAAESRCPRAVSAERFARWRIAIAGEPNGVVSFLPWPANRRWSWGRSAARLPRPRKSARRRGPSRDTADTGPGSRGRTFYRVKRQLRDAKPRPWNAYAVRCESVEGPRVGHYASLPNRASAASGPRRRASAAVDAPRRSPWRSDGPVRVSIGFDRSQPPSHTTVPNDSKALSLKRIPNRCGTSDFFLSPNFGLSTPRNESASSLALSLSFFFLSPSVSEIETEPRDSSHPESRFRNVRNRRDYLCTISTNISRKKNSCLCSFTFEFTMPIDWSDRWLGKVGRVHAMKFSCSITPTLVRCSTTHDQIVQYLSANNKETGENVHIYSLICISRLCLPRDA